MARNRISVSFSKKYSDIYELVLKEDNASELICGLLKKHYEGDITNRDIMDKIEYILSNVKVNTIDTDLQNAIDCW